MTVHMPSSGSGSVLLIDDDENIRTVLEMRLEAGGWSVHSVADGAGAMKVLGAHAIDVVLSDLRLEREDGLELMELIHEVDGDMPVLILTAHGSIPNAVDAMNRGAAGYITKPVDRDELFAVLAKALASRHLSREVDGLRRAVDERGELFGIIGSSPPMRSVFSLIERFGPTRLTAAIHGESGTGKELVAQALHQLSGRANKEFLAINCAALPEALLQSELFGYKRGAFTGATQDREGLFMRADGGTLFLDEIGDMSPALQVSLLRVLQEGEIMPVGGRGHQKVDVRVIVATHRDLAKLVEEGSFRADLFYRIHVALIHLPPLRERGEDIEILAQHFLARFAERHQRADLAFSGAALEAMGRHGWPGNVRELEHAVERAVVMAIGPAIEVEDLFLGTGVDALSLGVGSSAGALATASGEILTHKEARTAWERTYLERLLKSTGGNVSACARRAGKYRADIYALLRKHELNPNDYKA